MDILSVLREGTPKKGCVSNQLNRIANSFAWRQKYENKVEYLLPISIHSNSISTGDDVIDEIRMCIRQIPNGEIKDIGTGSNVWPAAVVLIKYLESLQAEGYFVGKSVIDIGAGTGIVGLACACYGASEVVLTDLDVLRPLMEENKQLLHTAVSCSSCDRGAISDKVCIERYEWGNAVANQNIASSYGIVLISDCILPKLYPIEPLVQAVDRVMDVDSVAYFSYEHRPYHLFDPRQEFRCIAAKYGLEVKAIPIQKHHKTYSSEEIELWEVRRKEGACTSSSNNVCESVAVKTFGDDKEVIEVVLSGYSCMIRQNIQQKGSFIYGYVWPASIVTCRFIFDHYSKHKHSSQLASLPMAIELGAGCGLTAMSLMMQGYDVIATDRPQSLDIMTDNISRFRTDYYASDAYRDVAACLPDAHLIDFDWTDVNRPHKLLEVIGGRVVQLIVCSDCLYSSASVEPLYHSLLLLCTHSATDVLIVNECRSALDEFISMVRGRDVFKYTEASLSSSDLFVTYSMTRPMRAIVLSLTKK